MNIGLIDVDGHNFPNLALMKISAYHRAKGDYVGWYSHTFASLGYHYDKVYVSKVFDNTYSSDIDNAPIADEVEYDVMHMIYVQYLGYEDVAEYYGKSYSWATSIHGRGLKHVQEILDRDNIS